MQKAHEDTTFARYLTLYVYEAVASFVGGAVSTLVVSGLANLDLSLSVAALIGGGTAALKVLEDGALDAKGYYQNMRKRKLEGLKGTDEPDA